MDDLQQVENGHGSFILLRFAVFSVPLVLMVAVSILSALNVVKITSFPKSIGIIADVTVSSTTGKMPSTFYDYAASFETKEKQKIYTNVGKTIFYQAYVKGDAVTVYHDPGNPFVAFVNHAATIWFFPILLTAVGFAWLILGAFLIRTGRAKS